MALTAYATLDSSLNALEASVSGAAQTDSDPLVNKARRDLIQLYKTAAALYDKEGVTGGASFRARIVALEAGGWTTS